MQALEMQDEEMLDIAPFSPPVAYYCVLHGYLECVFKNLHILTQQHHRLIKTDVFN